MGKIYVLGKSSLDPQRSACVGCCGFIFVVLLLICAASCYLGVLSSISDSCQSSGKRWMLPTGMDLMKNSVPSSAAGLLPRAHLLLGAVNRAKARLPRSGARLRGQSRVFCSAVYGHNSKAFIGRLPMGAIICIGTAGCWKRDERHVSPSGVTNNPICLAFCSCLPGVPAVVNEAGELTAFV